MFKSKIFSEVTYAQIALKISCLVRSCNVSRKKNKWLLTSVWVWYMSICSQSRVWFNVSQYCSSHRLRSYDCLQNMEMLGFRRILLSAVLGLNVTSVWWHHGLLILQLRIWHCHTSQSPCLWLNLSFESCKTIPFRRILNEHVAGIVWTSFDI